MDIELKRWLEVAKKTLLFAIEILVLYFAFKITIFFIPFLIAFVFAQIIEPLIKFCMSKFKMKRRISAILIFAIFLLILIGLITWTVTTLVNEASNFLNNFNYYFDKISETTQNIIKGCNFDKIHLSDEVRDVINNSSVQVIRNCFKLGKEYFA